MASISTASILAKSRRISRFTIVLKSIADVLKITGVGSIKAMPKAADMRVTWPRTRYILERISSTELTCLNTLLAACTRRQSTFIARRQMESWG